MSEVLVDETNVVDGRVLVGGTLSVHEAKAEFARQFAFTLRVCTIELLEELYSLYGPKNAFFIMGIATELPAHNE